MQLINDLLASLQSHQICGDVTLSQVNIDDLMSFFFQQFYGFGSDSVRAAGDSVYAHGESSFTNAAKPGGARLA